MSDTKTNPSIKPAATGKDAEAARKEFSQILAEIRAEVPPEWTEEDIEREVAAAIREVREGRREGHD